MISGPSVENPLRVAKVEAAILQNAQSLRLIPLEHKGMWAICVHISTPRALRGVSRATGGDLLGSSAM